MQRFLDLRSHVGTAARSLEQRELAGAGGGGERHLWIPLCGTHCLEILGSLMVVSSPAPLETNSSYTHRHPQPCPV